LNAAGDALDVAALLDQSNPSSSIIALYDVPYSDEVPASRVSLRKVYLSNVPDFLIACYLA
jgi:hypothetical protein